MRILFTDDFFTIRLHARITIQAMGHTFDEASHGDEAIRKISENDYDLVLMDIEMPVRNGLETTRFIREYMTGRKKSVPIIAITAHNSEEYFDSIKQEGFNGFISKPITRQKLEQEIKDLRWKMED